MTAPMTDHGIERDELHLRRIEMRGYRRSDGLFEVVGKLVDTKPADFQAPFGRAVPAGTPVHDMGVRIVFDSEMVVQAIGTVTDAAPYGECPAGGLALQALKGLRMTGGWGKEVRARIGGARSCTHLMELLMPLATVAFQSLAELRQRSPDALDADGRPRKIDSCYAYAAGGDLVRRRWPEFHEKPPTPDPHRG
jgi:hypothetical protein